LERRGTMSAYVVLEGDDLFETSHEGSETARALHAFGGEILASGLWDLLVGDHVFSVGMIIRFPDKDAANAWYYARGYEMLLDVDKMALDCCMRLID
jgi:uncharacterized protein (DUF1330 family)